jgi:hypothetical protein
MKTVRVEVAVRPAGGVGGDLARAAGPGSFQFRRLLQMPQRLIFG